MEHNNTSHGKQLLLIMILCCLIPVAILAAIFLWRIPGPQVLTYGLILLCPLGHVLMMALMGRGHHDNAADAATQPGGKTSAMQANDKGGAACH